MVYSKEIMEILPQLRNTEIVIPDKLAGFEIKKGPRDISITVRDGNESRTSYYVTSTWSVRWDFAVVRCIIYKVPSISTKPYHTEGCLDIVSLEPLIMEALGIGPERIEMPEIVCLPVPSWVTRKNNCVPTSVVSHEDIETIVCSVPEKQRMIAEYMGEVDNYMARFLTPQIARNGLMLTEYGKAVMMRITRRWQDGPDNFNAARLRKIVRKYVDLDFCKGEIFARRYMAENHGIDIWALERIASAYLEKTPAELELEKGYEHRREKEALARMENMENWMLSADVLYGYRSLDMLQFAVRLLGDRMTPEFAPLAPFFKGHFVSHQKLILYFQDAYTLEIEMESFPGDDLARVIACAWGLKKDGILLKSGNFDDESRRDHLAIAGRAMKAALLKIYVSSADARSCLEPILESREAALMYQQYGPFTLTDAREDADQIFERKRGMLWQRDK